MKKPAFSSSIAGRLMLVTVCVATCISRAGAQETNLTDSPTPVEPPPGAATNEDSSTSRMTNAPAVAVASPVKEGETNSAPVTKPAAAATALTYESFRLIAERNIFNQNREPRVARSARAARTNEARRAPRVEAFALVGTMSYSKGTFAFFDGSSSQYRKTLKVGDSIGTYQVKDVTQSQVKLASEKQEVDLKVGQQLRREDEGEWQVSARSGDIGSTAPAGSSTGSNDSTSGSTTGSPASASPDSGDASDLLKRLMQQREKELNK